MKPRWPRLAELGKKLLLVPPLLLGFGILAWAISTRRTPEPRAVQEIARPLRVVTAVRRDIAPVVVGYGLARPDKVWRAVVRVSGTVVETHPDLKAGSLVSQGTVLLRIDPTDYQLQVDRLVAETDALRAQIAQTERTRENNLATLNIEEQSLSLSQKEYLRQERLRQRGASPQSDLDQVERNVLQQQRAVQSLQNELNLIPTQLAQLKANLAALESQLAVARRDVDWTVIKAPFDCMLASVEIENGQYVSTNERLFEVHGVDSVEVEARLPIDDVVKLTPGADNLSSSQHPRLAQVIRGLTATVLTESGDYTRQYPAQLVRVREQVDRRTRTLGVVVRVQCPKAEDAGIQSPALLDGTFCKVVLEGHVWTGQLLVPVAAVKGNTVYVVNDRNRLEPRTIDRVMAVGDELVVRGPLAEGESVILSDPAPAVEGMLVDPVPVQLSLSAVLVKGRVIQ